MKEYAVVYEFGEGNWSAYSPDVPGCIATGASRKEVERQFAEALEFHFEGLSQKGLPIPQPQSEVGTVKVAA